MDQAPISSLFLTLNTLWANSADDKSMIFFTYFLQKIGYHIFMQIAVQEDN